MPDTELSKIDYNELSFFSTPIGQAVQKEEMNMLLGHIRKDTVRGLYISNINNSIYSISQSFWDIDLTIKLIKFAHPKIKSFKMTKVDRGAYIKYHLENYFFRLPKLKDQVLNLLNVVFQLGYSQSNGLEKKIRSNKALQQKNLLLFIDYLTEIFAEIKLLRDIIAHRGDLSDNNLNMLTIYPIAKYDEEEYHSILKRQISHTYIFEKNQDILKDALIKLLLVLYDDFENQLKVINEQS